MSILSILNEIKNTSSTNAKKAILEKNKNDSLLKKVIQLALDPLKVYGYKKLPEPVSDGTSTDLNTALDALELIASRKLTGHAGRDFIASVLGSVSENDAEVLRKVLTKNLDCGLQEKNVNSVFGANFIKEVPYQRCSLLNEKTIKNINLKDYDFFYSDLKMDGTYLAHTVQNSSVTTMSRNGKEYDFLGTKDEALNAIAKEIQNSDSRYNSGVVFLGEGVCLSDDGVTIMPRTYSNGIISKAGKNTISIGEAHSVIFVVWDAIPVEHYNNGSWDCDLVERRPILDNAIEKVNNTFVRMVEYKKVKSLKEAFEYNTELMLRGEEGSIIKSCDSRFKAHTSPTQLKVKLKMELDLRIIGIVEGEGKRKGTTGSLELQSECGILKCNLGTGFSDEMLDWIWNNQSSVLNGVCTVICNDIVYDKRTNVPSLFLPVFDCFRDDKNTADSFERILEIKESAVEVFSKKILESLC